MAIRSRNKINAQFSTASMSDLVFLLLIFFMLTSTLISPNAVKLLLPSSNSRTMVTQKKVTVYIDEESNLYLEGTPIEKEQLFPALAARLANTRESSIELRTNFNVPVQEIVTVIDAVNQVNESDPADPRHKVILATKPI